MIDFHMHESIGKPISTVNRRIDSYKYQNFDIDTTKGYTMGTLGSRLKELRKESGLTQKEVCARTGIKQGTLSELENDKYPTSSFVPHLASLYGVESLWLAEERGIKQRSNTPPALVTPSDNRFPNKRPEFGERKNNITKYWFAY